MPRNLSDETFDALKKAAEEIDFRAKRLQEWRSLGQATELYKARFDVFMTRLFSAQDPPAANELQGLDNAWVDCEGDLMDLEGPVLGYYQVITTRLNDGLPDPTVKAWIDGLVALGRKAGDDLTQRSFKALKEHTAQYKTEYQKLSIQRNAKLNKEVNELVAFATALRMKFE